MKCFSIYIFIITFFVNSYLQAREFLIVSQDFPPFNYEEKNSVTGGMADVMREVCLRLKYKCKFENAVFARALKLLKDGEVDAVLSLFPVDDRLSHTWYTKGLVEAPVVYAGLSKDGTPNKVKSVEDLSGWTVALTRGARIGDYALAHHEKVKSLKIVEEVDNSRMISNLAKMKYGPRGAILGTEPVLQYMAKKQGVEIETLFMIEAKEFVVGFSKKRIEIHDFKMINQTLEKMKRDGTLKKILSKYNLKAAS